AAARTRTQRPGKHLAVHASELVVKPDFQILRRYRRPLLLRLEHTHRPALEDYVHRATRLGSSRSLNLRIGISWKWTGVFILTLSKSGNDQLPINDLEHRWPISIIIAVGVDQISIRGCLLYLIEYAATFTFYTILSNTNQTIRDMTIFRCRPNKDLLISV